MLQTCKHPQVRIVSRDEEAEYLECELCGDIFEATEFRDMAIEEVHRPVAEDVQQDARKPPHEAQTGRPAERLRRFGYVVPLGYTGHLNSTRGVAHQIVRTIH